MSTKSVNANLPYVRNHFDTVSTISKKCVRTPEEDNILARETTLLLTALIEALDNLPTDEETRKKNRELIMTPSYFQHEDERLIEEAKLVKKIRTSTSFDFELVSAFTTLIVMRKLVQNNHPLFTPFLIRFSEQMS